MIPAPMGAVWIHAASVGEVAAAEVLWRALPGPRFLTTDTATGLQRARAFTPLSTGRPVDLPGAVAPFLAQARPRALVFVEGTWWPWLAHRARRAGVPVLRVSCKAGARTRRVPSTVLRRLWAAASGVAARDESEAAFLAEVHDVPVEVLGDLKAGIRPPPSPLRWTRPFVVGASVRDGDLRALLPAWRQATPAHQLLVAPRHPESWHPDEALQGMRWVRRSALRDGEVPGEVDVVWLDTLGELGSCLQGAAAAFVGGTFDPQIGGHAADEAHAWGVPTVAGPERSSNRRSLTTSVLAPGPGDLGEALTRAIDAPVPERDVHVGERVAAYVLRHCHGPSPELPPRPWARPLVPLWRTAVRADRLRRRLRPQVHVDVPVISVGSANARSPGRTSTVLWLAARLAAAGHRVGVALRGYRRGARGLACSWDGGTLGDEGSLLAAQDLAVAACRRRGEAVAALVDHGSTIVLLDDGRQSREVHRDLDVEVIDGRYPEARGMLPAGERRTDGWGDGDVALVHHPEAWPDRPRGTLAVHRRLGPWHRGGRLQPTGPQGEVAVWLGLGHPEEVLAGLQNPVARQWLVPDHAMPPTDLVDRVADLAFVCTDKDRMRLPAPLADRAWTRPVELDVEDDRWLSPFLERP